MARIRDRFVTVLLAVLLALSVSGTTAYAGGGGQAPATFSAGDDGCARRC